MEGLYIRILYIPKAVWATECSSSLVSLFTCCQLQTPVDAMPLEESDDEFLGATLAAFGLSSASLIDSKCCQLCDLVIDEGDSSKHGKYGFTELHKVCFNGLHCVERMTEKSQKLLKQVKNTLAKDVEKFKAIALSLVTKGKGTRSKAVRTEALNFIELLTRTASAKRKTSHILLPEDQYIAWHMFHCRMTEAASKDKWQRQSRDEQLAEYDDGELCVKVKKPTEISSSDKISSSKVMGTKGRDIEKDVGEHQLMARPDLPLGLNRGLDHLTSGMFGIGRSLNRQSAYSCIALNYTFMFYGCVVWACLEILMLG